MRTFESIITCIHIRILNISIIIIVSVFSIYNVDFFLNKGLINVYTIRDIRQISDIPHGIIVNNGITISILLFSLFVQLLFTDKVSL